MKGRICSHCYQTIEDFELERRLGCTMPVCSRCYITAVIDTQMKWELGVERLGTEDIKDAFRKEGILQRSIDKLQWVQFHN